MARQSDGRDHVVMTRLDSHHMDLVRAIADREGASLSAVAFDLVKAGLESEAEEDDFIAHRKSVGVPGYRNLVQNHVYGVRRLVREVAEIDPSAARTLAIDAVAFLMNDVAEADLFAREKAGQ